MNRPLLIIICDFLLISLLSLARFDQQPLIESEQPEMTEAEEAQGAQDMMEVLQLALEQERQSKEDLARELQDMQDNLQNKETALQEKDTRIEGIQENLENVEQRAAQLQREREMMQRQYDDTQKNVAFLQEQYVNVKQEARQLQEDLTTTSVTATDSRARLETIESELQVRRQEAQRMQDKMDELEKERQEAEEQKFQLALELKQSQTTEIIIREQFDAAKDEIKTARADVEYSRDQVDLARKEVDLARDEVMIVRQEKERIQEHAEELAEGVDQLAQKSEAIRQDIKDNTPLAANTIYNDFGENRIRTRFFAARSGLFGQTIDKESETNSVLVSDGTNVYALYHVEGTPFQLWQAESDWEQLTGVVNRGQKAYSIALMSFIKADPRLLVVPVGAQQAATLGGKIYTLAADPFKFQEAVLVGAQEGYYGEAEFKLDPANPKYVKMEKRAFRKLVGKFSPSKGDLVFSKTGELLGMMVNNDYCAVLSSIETTQKFRFGMSVLSEGTGRIMARQAVSVSALPLHFQ
jgi:hypothetical protein